MSGGYFAYRLLLLAAPLAACALLLLGWPWHFAEPARGTTCPWLRVATAWVDRDRDGVRDRDEPPLPGVRFVVGDPEEGLAELGGGTGAADGSAVVAVLQAECGESGARYVISALRPPGYTPTTPDRRGRGPGPFRFGFAPNPAPADP